MTKLYHDYRFDKVSFVIIIVIIVSVSVSDLISKEVAGLVVFLL